MPRKWAVPTTLLLSIFLSACSSGDNVQSPPDMTVKLDEDQSHEDKVKMQEEIMKLQEKEMDRQNREFEELKRQKFYNDSGRRYEKK